MQGSLQNVHMCVHQKCVPPHTYTHVVGLHSLDVHTYAPDIGKGGIETLRRYLPKWARRLGQINLSLNQGVSPGLVIVGDDSCSRGRGFKSQDQILDRYFSH